MRAIRDPMELTIDVETPDLWLAFDLIGEGRSLGTGTIAPIPGRDRLQLTEIWESATREPTTRLRFVLSFPIGAFERVIGGWLYEAINGRATGLSIERVAVPVRRGPIERALARQMQKLERAAIVGEPSPTR